MVPTQLVNSFTIHSISNYCKLKTEAKHLQQLYKATECQYNNLLCSIYRSVLSPSNPSLARQPLPPEELCQRQDLGVTNQIPTLHYVRL